jgi:phosphinothricin acetyltransferase
MNFKEIQSIYARYVTTTTVSLEETPPNTEELLDRWEKSLEKSLPYIVAEIDNTIAGYAYALPYRTRSGYRFTVEESVYVSEPFRGLNIGHALLSNLIAKCRDKSYKKMIAVIAGTDNIASIKFHETLGFRQAGILHNVGFKFDKWVDTVLMQKDLQE